MSVQTIIILISIGLTAGILSGFVGIGGGIVLVPALVFFLGFTQHQASGTSLALLMLPVGFLAVYTYYKSGNVNVPYALVIAIGFIAGAYLGSRFSLKLPSEIVKKVFAVFMIVMALKMIFSK